ncbi:MAG: hypothetical protein K2M89_03845 [Clostridiales bacterium]|nr:hypothetical protein [Clostridiales bacterium]
MSEKRVNALCTANVLKAKTACDRVIACCDNVPITDGVKIVTPYTKSLGGGVSDIYLPDMSDEDLLENACDYILSNNAHAVVRAAFDLTEAGIIEARYKLSPIMLLHKLGILGQCTIAGGVCLDNDDLDLMAQEGVPLILLPTADAGYGHGFAPVCAAVHRGMHVGIGTFDGRYNANADLDYEMKFLTLTANAEMRTENALDKPTLKKILAFE